MNTSSSAPIADSVRPASIGRSSWFGVSEITGRVLLGSLFLVAGLYKIGTYAGTVGYMTSFGVPGALLPIVIATEVVGALAIILGWKTRIASFLLAGYSLLTAVIFHHQFGNQIEMNMFLKDLSVAGGFLLLVANGAGPIGFDCRLSKRDR